MWSEFRLFQILFVLFASGDALAGSWGAENWGEIYWGYEQPTSPTMAPILAGIQRDDTRLNVVFAPYKPGEDGWSVITSYYGKCSDGQIVSTSSEKIGLEIQVGLGVQCSFWAENAFGTSRRLTINPNHLAAKAVPHLDVSWIIVLASALLTIGTSHFKKMAT